MNSKQVILRNMWKSPKEWDPDTHTLNHKNSGIRVWTANGFWFIDIDDRHHVPVGRNFNLLDKLHAYLIIQWHWGHWLNWLGLLAFGVPGFLWRKSSRRRREELSGAKKYDEDMTDAIGYSRKELITAIDDLIAQSPRGTSLTSPNEVVRYYAKRKNDKNKT